VRISQTSNSKWIQATWKGGLPLRIFRPISALENKVATTISFKFSLVKLIYDV
jgi:hypothetical protein